MALAPHWLRNRNQILHDARDTLPTGGEWLGGGWGHLPQAAGTWGSDPGGHAPFPTMCDNVWGKSLPPNGPKAPHTIPHTPTNNPS